LDEIEVAAAYYNMALIHYHKGNKIEALDKIQQFLSMAEQMLPQGPHVQMADAFYRKGKIMFEMGNLYESMTPLNEALKIRRALLGENDVAVAESLCLIGKVLQEREEYDFALNALEQGLAIQRHSSAALATAASSEINMMSFEVGQTLLEIGRAHHAIGHLDKALKAYLEVADVTRKFFGFRHPFVARIDNIIGNLYLETGDTGSSLTHFQEAMKIQVEHGMTVDMAVVQDPLLKVELSAYPGAQAA
jgi:tetratricopeptide (TPR) repeat protein